jgi:hypothetical protein
MRIVLATPLYPPEIAEPAPYVKELAKRLSGRHLVTIVAYTRLPEKVPGVSIIVVDKRRPLPFRLLSYFFALLRAAQNADIIYALNGASVELPVALVSLIIRRPLIIRIGDTAAHTRAQEQWALRRIERFAFSRARRVVTDAPGTRPEILPFEPFPTEKMSAYEQSWKSHLRTLENAFTYALS